MTVVKAHVRTGVTVVTAGLGGTYRLDRCHDGADTAPMPNTTGLDLKLERVRARLTVTAVAAQMGLSRQSVHGIERAADPGPERVRQHRVAVAAIRAATETADEATA